MQYTTVENLIATLPTIGSATTITSAVVTLFGDAAESLVNAKIAARYTVPVSGGAPLLQKLTEEIAIYELLAKRISSTRDLEKTEWPEIYKRAIEALDDIAAGLLPIVTAAGAILTSGDVPYSNTMNYVPTFRVGVEEVDSVVDQDRIDDEGAR